MLKTRPPPPPPMDLQAAPPGKAAAIKMRLAPGHVPPPPALTSHASHAPGKAAHAPPPPSHATSTTSANRVIRLRKTGAAPLGFSIRGGKKQICANFLTPI